MERVSAMAHDAIILTVSRFIRVSPRVLVMQDAVLDDFDLNVCAPMRPQRIGEAWHELLEWPGVARDIRVAESIGIEKMAQINGFATGKELLRKARRLLEIDMPSDGIGFNRIPRPKAWERCFKLITPRLVSG
jgi:hypothetical protein